MTAIIETALLRKLYSEALEKSKELFEASVSSNDAVPWYKSEEYLYWDRRGRKLYDRIEFCKFIDRKYKRIRMREAVIEKARQALKNKRLQDGRY